MSHRPALTANRLQLVRDQIAALSDLVYHLNPTSAEEDVSTATEAAWHIFDSLRDLTRPTPRSTARPPWTTATGGRDCSRPGSPDPVST